MAKQVDWNKFRIEEFLELSGINRGAELGIPVSLEKKKVFELHCLGATNEFICQTISSDINVVKDYIREFKDIYDDVQHFSKYLPPRKNLTEHDLKRREIK